jgi:hypothetical protein
MYVPIQGGVHRGVHQNVDYKFFTLSVYINNQFFRGNQHQQRIVKINNQQLKMPEIYNQLTKAASVFFFNRKHHTSFIELKSLANLAAMAAIILTPNLFVSFVFNVTTMLSKGIS